MRIEITAHVRDGLMPALASALPKEGFFPHTQANQSCHAQGPSADFRLTYHGTITTITPLSDACRLWLDENVEIEAWQRFGSSIAIEPRYVKHLAEAMIEEGLVIEGDQ